MLEIASHALFAQLNHQVPVAVEEALAAAECVPRSFERRSMRRVPYAEPIYVTPIDSNSQLRIDRTIVVLGKNISQSGIDCYYHEPLPFRRAIASVRTGEDSWTGLSTVFKWCRFTECGWYENGGRFLTTVESPMNQVDMQRIRSGETEVAKLREKIAEHLSNSQFFQPAAES